MRRGLVFGKFMPLHRGHQHLIDTALAECDDLTIVVYDSDPLDRSAALMPVELRLGWLQRLYPDVENILAVDDPEKYNPNRDSPSYAQEYAEQLRFLGRFDRVFSSERNYDQFVRELGSTHVVVDEARGTVPTSGTIIRADLYEHRGWMDPLVYSSLIQKVAFVGTESSGKSTLARACAEAFDTLWVHEFGRELWEAQNLRGTFADHLKTARRQYTREQAALRHARRFLFCDTTAWTTLHWSLRSYGTVDARLVGLVERTMREYIWVLCDNDFGWIQDGTREMAHGEAERFQEQQRLDLSGRGIEYRVVSGPLEQRLADVRELLATTASVSRT
jgi:HTH-type transcriptional regulator, transcriptional repressor of NAD biosynthesis genes